MEEKVQQTLSATIENELFKKKNFTITKSFPCLKKTFNFEP